MKFLFVSRRYPPFAGGAENQIARVACALAKRGHRVRVFTGKHDKSLPEAEEQYGVMILRLPDPKVRFWGTVVFLFHLIWQMRHRSYYDIVFANMIEETSATAIFIGKIFHKKTVFRLSSKKNLAKCVFFSLKKLYRKIVFCADYMIAQTDELKEVAVKNGYWANKIIIIPNIIPSSLFFRMPVRNRKILHILWCGRMHPDKNPLLFCMIAEILKDKLEFIIDVVGDGTELQKVKRVAAAKRLEEKINFHGFQKNTLQFYQNADIYLLTSDTDAMPNTVLEAMAATLPVVATNVNGVPVLVKDGESALLYPAHDAQKGAEAILKLAEDLSLRTFLGENARKRADELFSEQVAVRKYEELFSDMS